MEHGFYHPDIGYWQTIGEPSEEILATYPAGTIEVPLKPGADYQWQDGEWVYAPAPVDLGNLKASLKAQIDADAEAQRLKYITPGAGQSMAYLQKAMEATAYLAATDPDPADYPLLAAEVGITGDTIADVAAVVDAHYQAWRVIGAAIEQARLGAKAAVDAAETVEDAQAAYEAVAWPAS